MPPTTRTKKTAAQKKAVTAAETTAPTILPGGVPVPGATQVPDKYAATSWGAQPGNPLDGIMEDVTCPTGQVALIRRPGLQGLVAAGVLDHIDSLTQLVDSKHIKRAKHGGKPETIDVKALAKDTSKMIEVLDVVDKIIVHVVVKPKVNRSPLCKLCEKAVEWHLWADDVDHEPQIDLEPGKVYAFQVDIEDKMFIVNYAVGGTRDLESFRQQSEEALGRVESE